MLPIISLKRKNINIRGYSTRITHALTRARARGIGNIGNREVKGMLEKEIEAKLVRRVKKAGGLCPKFVSPNNPGVPDRIVILPNGRVIFVELKAEWGRLSNIQVWQREEFRARGVEVRVVKGESALNDFLKEIEA